MMSRKVPRSFVVASTNLRATFVLAVWSLELMNFFTASWKVRASPRRQSIWRSTFLSSRAMTSSLKTSSSAYRNINCFSLSLAPSRSNSNEEICARNPSACSSSSLHFCSSLSNAAWTLRRSWACSPSCAIKASARAVAFATPANADSSRCSKPSAWLRCSASCTPSMAASCLDASRSASNLRLTSSAARASAALACASSVATCRARTAASSSALSAVCASFASASARLAQPSRSNARARSASAASRAWSARAARARAASNSWANSAAAASSSACMDPAESSALRILSSEAHCCSSYIMFAAVSSATLWLPPRKTCRQTLNEWSPRELLQSVLVSDRSTRTRLETKDEWPSNASTFCMSLAYTPIFFDWPHIQTC
mmetsp:Transcript_109876/g.342477  ORF Transcript_109876/g.342477 Transcript_109876/m.342477 type:complete len:375 (+) Transcript_109876:371-1495(+)